MIVNQFRTWARTAVPSSRADGASALARAYLYSNLDAAQKANAVSTLTELLDDPSPLVRGAIAEAFASAVDAPHHIVLALAEDQATIAAIILARTPVLTEAELIDCAATAAAGAQAAIAARPDLQPSVAAALAEIAGPVALVALAQNASVHLLDFSICRMVERHGDHAELREALLQRRDLPAKVRIDLVAATARALSAFVSERNWMSNERMARVTREAQDKAAIVIAEAHSGGPVGLVAHLRQAGQLTVGFLFRTILSGNVAIFRAALAELSGVPLARVDGLTASCESTGFAALYRKAGLPADLLPAVRLALQAAREVDWAAAPRTGLSRHAIERVVKACQRVNSGELDKLIVLLRRFEAEAAREEARATPVPVVTSAPLTLKVTMPSERQALVLTDMDADVPKAPVIDSMSQALEHLKRPLFTVDLAALEAELGLFETEDEDSVRTLAA